MLMEQDLYIMSYLAARRVRADMRREAGVQDGGRQPSSNAMERRSLDDD
jgi:hypothetical protein